MNNNMFRVIVTCLCVWAVGVSVTNINQVEKDQFLVQVQAEKDQLLDQYNMNPILINGFIFAILNLILFLLVDHTLRDRCIYHEYH